MSAPPPRFRESAAIVLVRPSDDGLEVLWARRSDGVPVQPGFHAFVGGGVDRTDHELPLEGETPDAASATYACAIREAFEEIGVLVGLAAPVDVSALAGARQRLLNREATFPALAREYGWRFRADPLAFAGRWQTPPFATVRFDTVYFLVALPDGQEPTLHGGELASMEWIAPARAIERWHDHEAVFAAPILHTLIEIGRGPDGLAARLATAPERAGQPIRRIELEWGVVLQPMKTRPLPPATHTNAYLVGEREMALIDPGSGDADEVEALFALIDRLAADSRRLTTVLLTHHHPDHIGGLAAVRARHPVTVLAHADTARYVPVDRALADDELVSLAGDWTLRAIHTPGHTRGHLCFFHAPTRTLFTGDHVPGGSGTVIIDPPDGDMADYLRSLERAIALDPATLFPAHGSPQGGAVRRLRALVAHRLEREAKVAAALEAEPLALAALVERAYADTPRELWPYAERSLLAHLLKLEAEGRTARDGERWRRA